MHKLMTLQDLYNYYSTNNKSMTFSSKENNEPIVVQVDGTMNFAEEISSADGLYPVTVQLNFVGDNLNNSRIELKAQKNANSSSKYRPLLAYIHEVDGNPQFYGHNFHTDDDGNIVYDEQPVGVIIEEAHIEHDDEYDKDYAFANGYVWEEYSKATEILEREQKCDVSVELSIRQLSYNAEDHILVLDDFYYSGCTLLGCDENGNKVNPAMPGSKASLGDFTKSCYSQSNDKLVETLEKLNNTLSMFNINAENTANTLEEGGKPIVNKFEELLAQYSVSAEDITFEYENLSDEELETAFAKAFADKDDNKPNNEPNDPKEGEGEEDDDKNKSNNSVKFSMKNGEEVKTFSLSLNEKVMAMYNLVNETYGEADCDCYTVEVYEDDKYVDMHALFSERNFRQSFSVKKETYSLVGDRVETFARYMTQDEINAFEKMKADFAELQNTHTETTEKLAKYEAEPEKMQILNSEDYAQIAETAEFAELKKEDAHFDMSVEDVKNKADEMLLAYAKGHKLEFAQATENNRKPSARTLPRTDVKPSRYGTLFAR